MTFDTPLFIGAESVEAGVVAPRSPAAPDLESEVARILARLSEAGAEPASLLGVDCFVEDSGGASDADELRARLGMLLPDAARPVVGVIPVAGLAGGTVRLQAIAVPGGPGRFSSEARFPGAASRGEYFALSTGPAVADGLLEHSRRALAEAAAQLAGLGTGPEDVILADMEYVAAGSREEWEEAALQRAGFFAEPGPCATGITLNRVAEAGGSIQFRMLGVVGSRAQGSIQEAWPDERWTWPFPLPYRHGNRVGRRIVVGGQSSRGPHGIAMRGDDPVTQAAETVRSVASVLEELSSSLDDVVRLTAYYVGTDADAQSVRASIIAAMPPSDFDLTLVRVDHLAHETMLVEIEGLALTGTS